MRRTQSMTGFLTLILSKVSRASVLAVAAGLLSLAVSGAYLRIANADADAIVVVSTSVNSEFPDGMRFKEEKPGRNDPCSCGSGKKYKRCCL